MSLFSDCLNQVAPYLIGVGGFLGVGLVGCFEYLKKHDK